MLLKDLADKTPFNTAWKGLGIITVTEIAETQDNRLIAYYYSLDDPTKAIQSMELATDTEVFITDDRRINMVEAIMVVEFIIRVPAGTKLDEYVMWINPDACQIIHRSLEGPPIGDILQFQTVDVAPLATEEH